MANNFPSKPDLSLNPIPSWATGVGAVRSDPGETKRSQGWTFNSSLNSGEIPRLDWVNHEANITGQWCNYFDQCATFLKNLIYPSDNSYPASNSSFLVVMNDRTDAGNLSTSNPIALKALKTNTDSLNIYDSDGNFTAPITDYYKIDLNLIIQLCEYSGAEFQVFSLGEKFIVNTAGNLNFNRVYTISRVNFTTSENPVSGFNINVRTSIVRKLNAGDTITFYVYNAYLPSVDPGVTCKIFEGSTITYSWKF